MYFLVLLEDSYLLICQYDDSNLGVYSFFRLQDLEEYISNNDISYDEIRLVRCEL